jgi:hypothetical protein
MCDVSATVADARVVTTVKGETCVQYAIVISMLSESVAKMLHACELLANHRGDVRCFAVYRGFREFRDLQMRLKEEFPNAEGLPSLPHRTLFRSYDPRFISARRANLRKYVHVQLQVVSVSRKLDSLGFVPLCERMLCAASISSRPGASAMA